jgi:hypothetical protein
LAKASWRVLSTWAAARAHHGAAAVAADRRVAQSAQHAQRRIGRRRPAERSEAVRRIVLAQLALVGVLHQGRCRAVRRRSAHAPSRPRLPTAVIRVLKVARPVCKWLHRKNNSYSPTERELVQLHSENEVHKYTHKWLAPP